MRAAVLAFTMLLAASPAAAQLVSRAAVTNVRVLAAPHAGPLRPIGEPPRIRQYVVRGAVVGAVVGGVLALSLGPEIHAGDIDARLAYGAPFVASIVLGALVGRFVHAARHGS
jgi:hypothetical protein